MNLPAEVWDKIRSIRTLLELPVESGQADFEAVSDSPAFPVMLTSAIDMGVLTYPYHRTAIDLFNAGGTTVRLEEVLSSLPSNLIWLNSQPELRDIPPGSRQSVGLLVRAACLPPGEYTAEVIISFESGTLTERKRFAVSFSVPQSDQFRFGVFPRIAHVAHGQERGVFVECANYSDKEGSIVMDNSELVNSSHKGRMTLAPRTVLPLWFNPCELVDFTPGNRARIHIRDAGSDVIETVWLIGAKNYGNTSEARAEQPA